MTLAPDLAPLLRPAGQLFVDRQEASVSLLQRHFSLSHAAGVALMRALEERGAVHQTNGVWRAAPDAVRLAASNLLEFTDVHVNTLIGRENRKGGLLVCGINHGWSKEDQRKDEEGLDRSDPFRSFFSDRRVENHSFRNAVVKWFGLLGHPLQMDWRQAGAFERSIVHTNWLPTCSSSIDYGKLEADCIRNAHAFLHTCQRLAPALVVFFSGKLMDAFNSRELRPRVEELFGAPEDKVRWIQKELPGRFYVGVRRFERMTAISLPHATGAQGVSDEYIAGLKPDLSPLIQQWWEQHSARLV